ncbi:hypothetical protein BKA62DRAFT_428859 [Auriculariales sp. MPI-PUGE-AT-0066]|nr:hypothetical protein BKA62DRAFT_428859 [Auriculariales sp. MPI-PUGE-AT-0066]
MALRQPRQTRRARPRRRDDLFGLKSFGLHDYLVPDLVHRFVPLDELMLDAYGSPLPHTHTQSHSRLICTLPPELLVIVCAAIDDQTDLAFAALSCQHLYTAARPTLNARQALSESWAGDRLICVGERVRADDLPKDPTILSTEEVQQLRLGGIQGDSAWYNARTITLYTATDAPAFPQRYSTFADDLSSQLATLAVESVVGRFSIAQAKMWARLFRLQLGRTIKTASAVLCNHTLRTYLRGSLLVKRQSNDLNCVREFRHVRLGDLAALWMLWTSEWSLPHAHLTATLDSHTPGARELHKGPWAGHRVEIVHEPEFDLEGWADIGVELLDDAVRVYNATFGTSRRL